MLCPYERKGAHGWDAGRDDFEFEILNFRFEI